MAAARAIGAFVAAAAPLRVIGVALVTAAVAGLAGNSSAHGAADAAVLAGPLGASSAHGVADAAVVGDSFGASPEPGAAQAAVVNVAAGAALVPGAAGGAVPPVAGAADGAAALAALEPGRAFRIDPHSARAGFVLQATLHKVRGETAAVSGHVVVVGRRDGAIALDGAIAIAAATLDTGNKRRDRKMHGESLAVERHPEIRFVPRSFVPADEPVDGDTGRGDADRASASGGRADPGGAARAGGGDRQGPLDPDDEGDARDDAGGRRGKLAGDLTVRGVTRSVTLDVRVGGSAERPVVDGEVVLTWADFGVPNPSAFMLRVRRELRVEIHVELLPQADAP